MRRRSDDTRQECPGCGFIGKRKNRACEKGGSRFCRRCKNGRGRVRFGGAPGPSERPWETAQGPERATAKGEPV